MSTETQSPPTKSRPAFSQVRVPTSLQGSARFKRDPSRHYMLVELDSPARDYESTLDEYMHGEIGTDSSGDSAYTNHGYVAGECKSKRWVLLSCSKAFYEHRMRQNHQRAEQELGQPDAVQTTDLTTMVQLSKDHQNGGRPFTVDQLQGTFITRDAKTGYVMGQQTPAGNLGDYEGVR